MSLEEAKEMVLRDSDLVEIVSESVNLISRSGKKVGLCPFHEEKSPSFTIFDQKYYCFGCHSSGDILTFVMKSKSLGFLDAIKYLASHYRIPIPSLENKDNEFKENTIQQIYKLNQKAQKVFTDNLWGNEGVSSLQYLKNRGFPLDHIKKFSLGLAIGEPSLLSRKLKNLGFSDDIIQKSSLGVKSKYNSGNYDFFQKRIMFPIFDNFGRIVAFGGRTIVDDPAKYKNSRETPAFNKSKTLYGIEKAIEAGKKKNRIIVVEGYMDVLQLRSQGFEESVGILGTALTIAHLKILSRVSNQLYLVFDGDQAGLRATLKSVEASMSVPDLIIKVASLPKGCDPDSFVKEFGAEKFEEELQNGVDLLQFTIMHTLEGMEGFQILEVVKSKIIPWVSTISDDLMRNYLLAKISQYSGVSENALLKELSGGNSKNKALINSENSGRIEVTKNNLYFSEWNSLGQLENEFLAQIYLSKNSDLENKLIENGVKKIFFGKDSLKRISFKMLEIIGDNNVPLSELSLASWLEGEPNYIFEFFNKLRASLELYGTENRQKSLILLINRFELLEIKRNISHLKSQIYSQKSDQSLELIRTIQQLNTKKIALEGNLS